VRLSTELGCLAAPEASTFSGIRCAFQTGRWYEPLALLPGVLDTPPCLICSPQVYGISVMDSTGIRSC
jgi:hypothetical protein